MLMIHIFKAHSTRSVSTSRAKGFGASLLDILKWTNWSQMSTWTRFYNKKEISQGLDFQNFFSDQHGF